LTWSRWNPFTGEEPKPVVAPREENRVQSCRRSLLLAVLAFTVLVRTGWAQEKPLTNFELVRNAVSEACGDLVAQIDSSRLPAELRIRPTGTHEGNFLVESVLSDVLTSSGQPVTLKKDGTGPTLEFEIVDLGVRYNSVRRHAWLGSKRVEREARARIFARLISGEQGNILWSRQVESRLLDEVPQSELAQLSDRNNTEYLKAELPEKTWNKFVEPAVVTGIVIGLIVLFFANQDASS